VDQLREFFTSLYDAEKLRNLLAWGGYPALMAIIFAETGLLVGFFLPGDSMLVIAGVLVNAGQINPFGLSTFANLLLLNAVLITMAIIGDAVGFAFGYRTGPALFKREQSRLFRKDYLIATQKFYEKHGGKTIVLARFMPFVRTFAPIVAGIGQMSYRRFLMYNVFGGLGWITSMSFLGYFLAEKVGGDASGAKKIEKIVILIVLISVLPPVIGAVRTHLAARKAQAEGKATS
jgi:membrane-associated protein